MTRYKGIGRKIAVTALMLGLGLMVLAAAAPAVAGGSTILVSIHDPGARGDTLYAMDPASGRAQALFNFANHPHHKAGLILDPRVGPGGRYIYFSSDNANFYTPFYYNLFRITSDGRSWQQLTPGVNSGRWDQRCPCSVVRGRVRRRNGRPYSAAPVFLEGVGMVYSKPDGSFEFKKVPMGMRWLMAYRPGNARAYDSQLVTVAPGAPMVVDLIPNSTHRASLRYPVPAGDNLVFQAGLLTLARLNLARRTTANIYQVGGTCSLKQISGFDLDRRSGRLAILDYATGCPTNRGLYVTQGNALRLLLDTKTDQRWCGVGQVFWSPDGTKLALSVCLAYGNALNQIPSLLVLDAASGRVLGNWGINMPSLNLGKMRLHGWSPDGRHLLFSWYTSRPSAGNLSIIGVGPGGTIDPRTGRHLIRGRRIDGATWAVLKPPAR